MEYPLCIDCKHLRPDKMFPFSYNQRVYYAKCAIAPRGKSVLHLIDGTSEVIDLHYCSTERNEDYSILGTCGATGRHFEPSGKRYLPFWKRLLSRLGGKLDA